MSRVTVSLPDDVRAALKQQADRGGLSESAFAARAIRNEVLRRQLEASGPPSEVPGWLDDAEHDEGDVAGAA
jgi:predicted transcriptional regulator